MSSGDAKRIRLTNRVSIFAGLLAMPQIFIYAENGVMEASVVQIFTVLGLLAVPLVNHFNQPNAAKLMWIVIGNINVFFTSNMLGLANGDHLAFIAMMLVAFMMIEIKQKTLLIIVTVTNLLFFFALEFGVGSAYISQIDMDPATQQENYLVNFLATYFVVVIGAYYFQNLSNKQVDDIIFRAQQELKAVFNNSIDAIFIADVETQTISVGNAGGVSMFGADKVEDLLGKNLPSLMQNAYTALEWDHLQESLDKKGKWTQERVFQRFNGDSFWGNVAYTFIRYGEKYQLLIRISDVSEQKQVQQELTEAKEKAEAANIAKAHFLNNMSHEIRTPINGVIGLAEIIGAEYEEDEELISYSDLLLESGQRLLRTIGAILDLSKLESQQESLDLVPVDIQEILAQSRQTYLNEAESKGIALELIPADSPATTLADPELVSKVLDHIVSNAVKFTEEGQVTLWVEQQHNHWAVAIKDTGIGMSRSFITDKLFMKFEQESEGLDRNYEGSGLGLSLAKRILDVLKATISVESEKGVGSTFWIKFPAQEAVAATPGN
ncbi:MAG: PAS domain-containing sensor histidine kinase [Bacteroidota bacterium]